MKINIATLFPGIYNNFLEASLIGRAIKNNILCVDMYNMFDYVAPAKRVDVDIVGHGSGMILPAPLIESVYDDVVKKNNGNKPYVIFFSPHGEKLTQKKAASIKNATKEKPLLLFAGRYEGIDARAEEFYADEIISIGEYVLFGGDLPAMVLIESLARLVPGVVGKLSSVVEDSFQGALVDSPHYGAPQTWKNINVPPVLKSGDHAKIAEWRQEKALERTLNFHWQWFKTSSLDENIKKNALIKLPNHYVVLLHNDVVMPDGTYGESTVTSIDIHDIARSSATYGIKKYIIVTRLESQYKIVKNFLGFWHGDKKECNLSRAHALESVDVMHELSDAIEHIANIEGIEPITIATSSRREIPNHSMITYYDQEKIWREKRPILFVFGTSHGISPDLMNAMEYRLVPLEGLKEFNFLSVRSAVAIILDRWLGISQK